MHVIYNTICDYAETYIPMTKAMMASPSAKLDPANALKEVTEEANRATDAFKRAQQCQDPVEQRNLFVSAFNQC